jgi:Prp18 domain.
MKDLEEQDYLVLKLHVYNNTTYLNELDILNDETQRKYLQAIKRLMTVAQKKDPADYSRNVNMSI